ncbi:clathrin coat assembly protein, putative [Leishmania guyanensis]|uniref:ANTH domain containing protein n=2 Tax=Leishmania guyanensis species complex TaxID=38579 RepID=A0AAW3BND0_9TRYP|nr:clathrin coat assembly protein, putative [Leishmania guyanensis]
MNNTDAKQSAGYFKEKATIGLSTFSGNDVVKAILKSTSHLLKAPKEKYLQKLVAASYGHYGSEMKEGLPINEFIVRQLEKRSHTHNWIVVLKTMVSFHRLLCEASDSMVETICCYKSVFKRSRIKNLANSADGAGQAFFITQYMAYLEERCVMQSALGRGRRIEIPEFEEFLKTLNVELLEPVFEILLRLLEAVPVVEFREAVVNNFCTMEAYQLLVRDGKRLFQHLAKRVIFVLDGFEEFSLPVKRRWLDLYRRYASAFASIKQYFDSILCSSRVFVEPVPQLKPLPVSLLARLEGNIRASEVTKDEPCTLESLGIRCGEDVRVDTNEEKILPPLASEPAVAEQPDAVAARTLGAPSFSLDDLFVSKQESSKPMQPASIPVSWPSSAPPATSLQCGAEQCQVNTFAPGNWSTGAPQNWETGIPTTFQVSVAQQQPFFSGGVPLAGENASEGAAQLASKPTRLPAPSKKPVDPFKELYDRSHLDLN